ncbi:hypothetical protein [Niabella ginsenosidivorans]|nr:hypothetical protein [Niabella ginsenosidivorans]
MNMPEASGKATPVTLTADLVDFRITRQGMLLKAFVFGYRMAPFLGQRTK